MQPVYLYGQFTKASEERHEVTGVIAAEVPDRSGEILDYEKSKPNFVKWSESVRKESGGKSRGNVRRMHGLEAVGKLVHIGFDDPNKRIIATAKISDPRTWEDIKEGVLTGFSVGGRYASRSKADPRKYAAEPFEVSVVDRPCIPGATFELIHADGSTEQRKFAMTPPQQLILDVVETVLKSPIVQESIERNPASLPRQGTTGEQPEWGELETPRSSPLNSNGENTTGVCQDVGGEKDPYLDDGTEKAEHEVLLRSDGYPCDQDGNCEDGGCECQNKVLPSGELSKSVGGIYFKAPEFESVGHPDHTETWKMTGLWKADKQPYGDVTYADPGYQKDKVKRYPLDSEKHVRAAWSYINMPKNAGKYSSENLASVKSKIRAALKRIGADVSEKADARTAQDALSHNGNEVQKMAELEKARKTVKDSAEELRNMRKAHFAAEDAAWDGFIKAIAGANSPVTEGNPMQEKAGEITDQPRPAIAFNPQEPTTLGKAELAAMIRDGVVETINQLFGGIAKSDAVRGPGAGLTKVTRDEDAGKTEVRKTEEEDPDLPPPPGGDQRIAHLYKVAGKMKPSEPEVGALVGVANMRVR